MDATLGHAIGLALLENEIDALGNLLCEHENDDEAREVILESIDIVCANLDRPIEIDDIFTIL